MCVFDGRIVKMVLKVIRKVMRVKRDPMKTVLVLFIISRFICNETIK